MYNDRLSPSCEAPSGSAPLPASNLPRIGLASPKLGADPRLGRGQSLGRFDIRRCRLARTDLAAHMGPATGRSGHQRSPAIVL